MKPPVPFWFKKIASFHYPNWIFFPNGKTKYFFPSLLCPSISAWISLSQPIYNSHCFPQKTESGWPLSLISSASFCPRLTIQVKQCPAFKFVIGRSEAHSLSLPFKKKKKSYSEWNPTPSPKHVKKRLNRVWSTASTQVQEYEVSALQATGKAFLGSFSAFPLWSKAARRLSITA